MSIRTLFDRLMSRPDLDQKRRPAPRAQNCRLAVETLEGRLTPSAMLTISDVYVLEGNDGVHNAQVTVSLTEPHGLALLNQEVTRQAAMIAYLDDFTFMMWVAFAAIPLLVFVRRPRRGAPPPDEAVAAAEA